MLSEALESEKSHLRNRGQIRRCKKNGNSSADWVVPSVRVARMVPMCEIASPYVYLPSGGWLTSTGVDGYDVFRPSTFTHCDCPEIRSTPPSNKKCFC
jgi:hypothetical protein